ncbi:MAG TPA: NifU family protein [Flavobacteriaceae bacterium]|nr:NifU family protein [Flavobacteriaceae bacterium]
MHTYSIDIKPTSNPAIVKFETDRFLTQHENFEFSNIDEAQNSPLAQQLFHLPFVKTVYIAQNFVAIEKYNIVGWNDVQTETAAQIAEYLNNGGTVVKESDQDAQKKIAVTVYAESTPNPSVMKFVCNKKLVLQTAEFKNIDEAKNSPLAQQLFHFPFVKAVFFDENYISINKFDIAEWNEITLELREFIRTYLEEGKTVFDEGAVASVSEKEVEKTAAKEITNLDTVSQEIVSILDEYIKPAVASDGGNIVFDSYNSEDKKVKVILQGACSGCPSSTLTLKNGIETMLKEMLHGKVETVEAVNG